MAERILKNKKLLSSNGPKGRVSIFAIGQPSRSNGSIFVHDGVQIDAELWRCISLIVFDEFKDDRIALKLDGKYEIRLIGRCPGLRGVLVKGESGVVDVSMTDSISRLVKNLNSSSSDWLGFKSGRAAMDN